jgi:WXG100 family type VII secretion target
MASGQIRMTPEQMRARAREFGVQGERTQEVINNMDRLLNMLQEEWEGEASRSFKAKFEELRPGFVKTRELIEDINKVLTDTARITEETDRSLASQIGR